MAEIRHLENRHDVIFFCRGWSDLDKISQTGAEWYVDCGDMVEIETRTIIPTWRTFGRIQWHVIPEPHITLQGAATWWIHCHDSRATCHITGCKNSIRHIENLFSAIFYFLILRQFGLWRVAAFISSLIHLSSSVITSPSICFARLWRYDLCYRSSSLNFRNCCDSRVTR